MPVAATNVLGIRLPADFLAGAGCLTCGLRWCPSRATPALRNCDWMPYLRAPHRVPSSHAVLVVGPESSGTKLAARTAAAMLAFKSTGSRGARAAGNWSGHGCYGAPRRAFLVIHRSLPHNRCFPRIGELLRYLREKHARVSLALVTRSPAAALRSALRSHQPDLRAAQREQATAISIMGQLAGGPPAVLAPGRLFHYSYDDMLNATSRRKMLFAYARWLGLLPSTATAAAHYVPGFEPGFAQSTAREEGPGGTSAATLVWNALLWAHAPAAASQARRASEREVVGPRGVPACAWRKELLDGR